MQDNTEDQLRKEQTNNVGTTEEHLLLENRNLREDTAACSWRKVKGRTRNNVVQSEALTNV
jgi:hypothetical protein